MATSSATNKPKSYFPLGGQAEDGWSTEDEATATCYCGAVQLAFRLPLHISPDPIPDTLPPQPTKPPGLTETFACNCADCHKFTASMFATNFTVLNTHLRNIRGQENLKQYSQSKTIASGNNMTNYFCGTCGSLLYRISSGFPDKSIMRVGTVDDFTLHSTVLRPGIEQFVPRRPVWLPDIDGAKQYEGESHGGETPL
ncbi:MAG: hypothetical protein Q9191_001213 [Dirinaria sp. TL-2023a]